MIKLSEFNQKVLQQSEIKPFKLIKNDRGVRVWESENNLRIKATQISSNVYYEVSIINGLKIGDINRNGQKLTAKDVQNALSEFASRYNFHYVKNQAATLRKCESGRKLFADWQKLRDTLLFNSPLPKLY